MNETERLAEVAALHHERKRKAEELAAIDLVQFGAETSPHD